LRSTRRREALSFSRRMGAGLLLKRPPPTIGAWSHLPQVGDAKAI
jgi:hypothetical protein